MIRPLQIGSVTLPNNLILAPMAGVTDLPFRLLCKEQGAGLLCMEMVSAKAILYKNRNTQALLTIDPRTEFPEFRHPGRDMIWAWEQADQRYVSCRNSWQEFRVLIRRYRRLRRTEFTDQGRGKRWKSFSRFSDFR